MSCNKNSDLGLLMNQVYANCGFTEDKDPDDLKIITRLDDDGIWHCYVLKTIYRRHRSGRKASVLSADGSSYDEVIKNLHRKSAKAIDAHILEFGFGTSRDDDSDSSNSSDSSHGSLSDSEDDGVKVPGKKRRSRKVKVLSVTPPSNGPRGYSDNGVEMITPRAGHQMHGPPRVPYVAPRPGGNLRRPPPGGIPVPPSWRNKQVVQAPPGWSPPCPPTTTASIGPGTTPEILGYVSNPVVINVTWVGLCNFSFVDTIPFKLGPIVNAARQAALARPNAQPGVPLTATLKRVRWCNADLELRCPLEDLRGLVNGLKAGQPAHAGANTEAMVSFDVEIKSGASPQSE